MSIWEAFVAAPASDRAAVLDAVTSAQLSEVLLGMPIAERRQALGQVAPSELALVLAKLPQRTLVALGRQGVAALGNYRARLTKRERVRGTMADAQTLELVLRSEPLAFRLEFKSGPNAGRRVLYNSEIRRGEVRVKEGGALGLVGGLWLDLDNPLTRLDSNHRATEIGFGALLDLIEGDLKEAELKGVEHIRTDEGVDESGTFHSVFRAPEGVLSLYAASTRFGFDPAMSLPVTIEVHDTVGLLETYRYSAVESIAVDNEFFTLRSAKM